MCPGPAAAATANRSVLGDFTPGPGPQTLAFGPFPFPGVTICQEIIFPGDVVDDRIRPTGSSMRRMMLGSLLRSDHGSTSPRPGCVRSTRAFRWSRGQHRNFSAVVDPFGRVTALLDLGEQGSSTQLPRPLRAILYASRGLDAVGTAGRKLDRIWLLGRKAPRGHEKETQHDRTRFRLCRLVWGVLVARSAGASGSNCLQYGAGFGK